MILIMQVMTLFSDMDFFTTFSEAADTSHHHHRQDPEYLEGKKDSTGKRKMYGLNSIFTFAEVYWNKLKSPPDTFLLAHLSFRRFLVRVALINFLQTTCNFQILFIFSFILVSVFSWILLFISFRTIKTSNTAR